MHARSVPALDLGACSRCCATDLIALCTVCVRGAQPCRLPRENSWVKLASHALASKMMASRRNGTDLCNLPRFNVDTDRGTTVRSRGVSAVFREMLKVFTKHDGGNSVGLIVGCTHNDVYQVCARAILCLLAHVHTSACPLTTPLAALHRPGAELLASEHLWDNLVPKG